VNLRTYPDVGRATASCRPRYCLPPVSSMTFRHATVLSPFLLLLAACSSGAPNPGASAAGKARGPATASTSAANMRENVRQLTARGPENLEISEGPVRGSKVIRVRSGYSEVILARTNPDGTVSTRCVESGEGADEFLDGTSPSTSLTRAAQ